MIKQFSESKYATFLIYFMLLISIIVCAIYVGKVHATLKDKFNAEMSSVLEQKSQLFSKDIKSGYRMIRERANFIENKNINKIYWQEYIKSFSDYETYERISIIDLEGNMVSSDGLTENVANERYYQESLNGKESISDVFIDPKSKNEVIVLSIPLKKEGKIIGAITMTKQLETLKRTFTSDFLEGDVTWLVVDENGNELTGIASKSIKYQYDNLFEKLKKFTKMNDAVEQLISDISSNNTSQKPKIIRVNFLNQDMYLGYVKIDSGIKKLNLVAAVSAVTAIKQSQKLVADSFFLCVSIIGILLVMAIYIAYMREHNRQGIEMLAYKDTLTQIDNFNGFQIKVAELTRKNANIAYAIVCFGIKNFKYINETYGYGEGDRVLTALANTLKENFDKDETCARMTGDKFAVLYKIDDDHCTRFQKVLNEFVILQSHHSIKSSIVFNCGGYRIAMEDKKGINTKEEEIKACYPHLDYKNIISMLDKANLARSIVSDSDCERFRWYDNELMKHFIEENEITSLMKKALENKEFKVYLQPKYDLKSLKIVGAEALVRWTSAEKGFMSPDAFISIFEKNGFIIELDFYILEAVCQKIRYWLDHNITPVPISVNQSRIHMNNPLYINRLSSILEKYKIPAKYIELELTETMFFDNTQKLVEIIGQMRKLGIAISMDDFGSGYSSLNLLKELPVDTLKIDKGFLYETENSNRSKIIIEQVVEMARKLGMMTICEGVEVEEQAKFLRDIDCDIAQGYLYARPMPMEEFDEFRNKHVVG